MSTILQALKRLEKERGNRNAVTASYPSHAADTTDGMHAKTKIRKAWLRVRVLIWVGAGLVVVISAFVYFHPSRSTHSAPAALVASVPFPASQMIPGSQTPIDALPEMVPGLWDSDDHPIRNERVSEAVPKPLASSMPESAFVPSTLSETETADALDGFRDGHDNSERFHPPASAPAARPADADLSASDRFAGASRLVDGRLTVQAIAASDIPHHRMAVINNRIVREGATVEGFTIIEITAKAVYAREGRRLWEVPFGRP